MTFLRFDKRCKLYRAAVTLLSLFVIFSFRKGRFENLEIVPFVQKFSLTDICSLTNEKLPPLKVMIMTFNSDRDKDSKFFRALIFDKRCQLQRAAVTLSIDDIVDHGND